MSDLQIARYLDSADGPVRKYTSRAADVDSLIEPIVVFSGERIKLEQEEIPEFFWPATGKWKMRGERLSRPRGWRSANRPQIFIRPSVTTRATTPATVTPMRNMALILMPAPLSLCGLINVRPLTLTCSLCEVLTIPDVSKVMSIDDTEGIGQLFDAFCVRQTQNGTH
jgi:hypothetical protein